MNSDDRELIANQIEVIAEDVRRFSDNPFRGQIYNTIEDLFEIMVQLKQFARKD